MEDNLPEIEGEDDTMFAKQRILYFMETLQDLFLIQHVIEPTRYRHSEEPSLLDLIITHDVGMVDKLTYHPALGDSDDCCMKFKLNCYANTHKRKEENNNYRAHYTTIKSRLGNIDWETMLNGTIKEDYLKFVEQIHLATVVCIPNRISSRKKKKMTRT